MDDQRFRVLTALVGERPPDMSAGNTLRVAANLVAPGLMDYMTTPAPSPSYEPNAAGKIPSLGYHPSETAAGADLMNLIFSLPTGGSGKLAMAALPMAARAARESIRSAAVKFGDRIYTGVTHADALENAAKALGRSSDDILHSINASGRQHELGGFLTSSDRFVGRDEATKIADAAAQLRRRDELLDAQGSVSLPLDASNVLQTDAPSSIDWLVQQLNKKP